MTITVRANRVAVAYIRTSSAANVGADTLHPPFELSHAAFPVLELGYSHDLDCDVCHHALERRLFGILPGGALHLTPITFGDGKP